MELAPVHLLQLRGVLAAVSPLRSLQQGIHLRPAEAPRGRAGRLQQLAEAFQGLAGTAGQPGLQLLQAVPPGRRPALRLERLLGLRLRPWRRQGLPQGLLKGGHSLQLLPAAGQGLATAGGPQLPVGSAEDFLDLGPGVGLGLAGRRSRGGGGGGDRDPGQLAQAQQCLQGQAMAPLQGLQIRECPPATLGHGLGPHGRLPDKPLGQRFGRKFGPGEVLVSKVEGLGKVGAEAG